MAGGGTNLFISTNSGATWTADSIPWDFQFAVPKWVSVACSADGVTLLAIRASEQVSVLTFDTEGMF